MKIPFVDLYAQYATIKSEIDEAIQNVIRESAYIRSHYVDKFEDEFAKAIDVNYCVSCGNATDALYILMKGLKLKPGDEVITTAHSWISTSETITQAGGKVIFCDTDEHTFTIDPKLIEAKITSRTVGIIPVHLYGQPADMDHIMEIAKRKGLWVIEDCAQAHLAEYKGHKVGTFGNAAIFSFYPGKNLGAMGDAGCFVTNDQQLAQWCTLFARHGGKGEHHIEGINSRLDGIQAAILSVKLPLLTNWTNARREIANKYDHLFSDLIQVTVPKIEKDRDHVFHLYVLKVEKRDNLKQYLHDNGIATMLNYPKALPFYPAYAYLNHTKEDFPNAFLNQNKIISIPIYPEMTDEQINYISNVIHNYYSI
jgi:dTDP-4-amino-4,6-dideoxygalactose transaminase